MTKAFVFAFLVAFLAVASAQSFSGAWTDSVASDGYGETLYFCDADSNDRVSGVYSEVGVVRGKLSNSGQTLTGEWYEGGLDNNWGHFVLNLADDGDSFSGTWTYNSDPFTSYSWAETRTSNDEPSSQQCLYYNSAHDDEYYESLKGHWSSSSYSMYLCDGGSDQFASSWDFEIPGTTTGVNVGFYYLGRWLEVSNGQSWYGPDLWVKYGNGGMANTWWSSVGIEDVPAYIDSTEHGVVIFEREGDATSDECLANYHNYI